VTGLESVQQEPLDLLSRTLGRAIAELDGGLLLVVTGAGISAASGIPTFRGNDPQAVWRQSDVRLATRDYFLQDPVGQLEWYFDRFEKARSAGPNAAHEALVELESYVERHGGSFQLVTQNIDTLHELAGSNRLIKVHGTIDKLRCSRNGCTLGAPYGSIPLPSADIERFRRRPSRATLPRCPACDSVLRAHVLFFDEHYFEHGDYRFAEVEQSGCDADLMLFIGTSFSVGVTDLLARSALRSGAPTYSINTLASDVPYANIHRITSRAERILPALVRHLDTLVA